MGPVVLDHGTLGHGSLGALVYWAQDHGALDHGRTPTTPLYSDSCPIMINFKTLERRVSM